MLPCTGTVWHRSSTLLLWSINPAGLGWLYLLIVCVGRKVLRKTRQLSCLIYLQGEDDGTTLVDLDSFIAEREGQRLTGVYALYDVRRSLQYVGYARSIVLAIKVTLLLLLAATCALQGALQPSGCWLRWGH